jgi:hypothetical protein
MFVTIQRENIHPLKKRNEHRCYNAIQTARCLQLRYEPLRLLIADQYEVFRPPACSVLPPHCIKDVYTSQGSTRDLWTVAVNIYFTLRRSCAFFKVSSQK